MRTPYVTRAVVATVFVATSALAFLTSIVVGAQTRSGPTARLIPTTTDVLPADVDSNSPAVWERVAGRLLFFVFTSTAGQATRHVGSQVTRLAPAGDVAFSNHPGHGVWFEAIVPDIDGTWYGYYHNERPSERCQGDPRSAPRIGAARSRDFGETWEDLGVVLEAPQGSHDCGSSNVYFVGGVGDFSVVLDSDRQYLYFFFSQYASREQVQGVATARLAWADRDDPSGKAMVWLRNRVWLPARRAGDEEGEHYLYPAGAPIYPVAEGWHDGEMVDAYWGPSVHWNTYLEQYVMLLNRAENSAWAQEGIYITFTATPEDPRTWSTPQRLLAGGRWYPQVIGLEAGSGTDKVSGRVARLYMSGHSRYFIEFSK